MEHAGAECRFGVQTVPTRVCLCACARVHTIARMGFLVLTYIASLLGLPSPGASME